MRQKFEERGGFKTVNFVQGQGEDPGIRAGEGKNVNQMNILNISGINPPWAG